jgi:hypothetical protein
MPEMPEIFNLANQMNSVLPGQAIRAVRVLQGKCLNMPVDEFIGLITGKCIETGDLQRKVGVREAHRGYMASPQRKLYRKPTSLSFIGESWKR